MLVTFSTDAHANITMFGEDALSMLRMMGHSATVPGAILAADVPNALERLAKTVGANAAAPAAMARERRGDVSVSLGHRGQPLIDLMADAARQGSDVMWDKSTALNW